MKASPYIQLAFWSAPVVSVVRRLLRFKASGEFNAGVSYEAWLRWYTPLCERGVR